jgi:hypothetical protein
MQAGTNRCLPHRATPSRQQCVGYRIAVHAEHSSAWRAFLFTAGFSSRKAGYPSLQAQTGDTELGLPLKLLTRKKMGLVPEQNRMPYRPHGVKVEAQVVDGVQDLRQYFVRCVEMP